jgi:cell division protein FtsZ
MIDYRVPGVEFICVNADARDLSRSRAHKTIQLGTSGLSMGSRPDLGHEAASQAKDEIRAAIESAHMVFIIAGMGGGTGTGAAPVIARIAKRLGVPITVGVATMPFDFEGEHRWRNAEAGLNKLNAQVGALIVMQNEKLMQTMPDVSSNEAFDFINDLIQYAVLGVAAIINMQGQVCVDFEDVRTILCGPGEAKLANEVASGTDRARYAVENAIADFKRDGINLAAASGVLILVSGAKESLKLADSKLARLTVLEHTPHDSNVIYGAYFDETMGESIRVTLVAKGA